LSDEDLIEAIYAGRMLASYRRHLHDLAIEQLYMVVLVENPSLSHTMVFVNRE